MFEEVRTSIATLEAAARDLEPGCLAGPDAAALLKLVARAGRVCTAIETLLAGRIAETGAWRRDGHRTAAHWVAATTGETVGAACRTLDTARSLHALPATAEAFRAGELSAVQAAEITAAAGDAPGAETGLLEAAARSSVKGLRDRCREVRAGAQGDDAEWARRLHETRHAHKWADPDGAWRADIRLSPEVGARVDSAWDAHIERVFAQARAEGRREPRAAYAADAFVALVTEGPIKPPEVRLVVDHVALVRGHTEAGERCEITGVGPVPVLTARELLEDASVAVLTCKGDDITAVSSPTRTIPAKLRRALETRYPVCGVKTCDNDRGLEIDHVVGIAQGGTTEEANTWRICPHHHKLKTHCGWRVVGTPGNWDLAPPDDPDPP